MSHSTPVAAADPHQHRSQPLDTDSQGVILELEGEILAEHLASIVSWLPVGADPRRVVDLGCGTGAGTFALLTRFPASEVIAVDASAHHLRRLGEKAAERGLVDRVRRVLADLDGVWPDLDPPELVWASASLHHLADPNRVLRKVHDLLLPGGLFAVVELGGSARFLPEDAPQDRPGLEGRCHSVIANHHADYLPHRGADWGPMLTAAGFEVEGTRTIAVNVDGSKHQAVRRYALASLSRLRDSAVGALDAEDLTALDRLLDRDAPDGILQRRDLALRTERTVWVARRPLVYSSTPDTGH